MYHKPTNIRSGSNANPEKILEFEDLERQIKDFSSRVSSQQSELYTLPQQSGSKKSYRATANLRITVGKAEFTVNLDSDDISKLKDSVLSQLNHYGKEKPSFVEANEMAHLLFEESAFLFGKPKHKLRIESDDVNEVSNAITLFVEGFNLENRNGKSRKSRRQK